MTHDDIATLFQYHAWAHERLLSALDPLPPADFTRPLAGSFASIRDTVAHMLLADELWYDRWCGSPGAAFAAYDSIPDVSTARERWRAFGTQVRALVDELGDDGLQRTFNYRLKSGAGDDPLAAAGPCAAGEPRPPRVLPRALLTRVVAGSRLEPVQGRAPPGS